MIITENTLLFADRLKESGFDINTEKPSTGKFGDSKAMSDYLIALILEGKKTATCGLLESWKKFEEPVPTVGDIEIVLDWNDEPAAAIQYTEVEIKPFNQISEDFAKDEGEGDGSFQYWREAHLKFFNRECKLMDREFSEDNEIVCLRFELVGKFVMEM